MKPKEYLVKHGHLSAITRGRLSLAHIEILKSAVASGVKIEGYEVKPGVSVSKNESVVTKVATDSITEWVSPSDYRFPESDYRVIVPKEFPYPNKVVGMRNVCDTCNLSLLNHICEAPRLFGYTVTIERKR